MGLLLSDSQVGRWRWKGKKKGGEGGGGRGVTTRRQSIHKTSTTQIEGCGMTLTPSPSHIC